MRVLPCAALILPRARAAPDRAVEDGDVAQAPVLLHEERSAERIELLRQNRRQFNGFPYDGQELNASDIDQPDVSRVESIERGCLARKGRARCRNDLFNRQSLERCEKLRGKQKVALKMQPIETQLITMALFLY